VDGIAEYAFRQADFPFAESTSGLGVGATQEFAGDQRFRVLQQLSFQANCTHGGRRPAENA
ncbi:hypothetical protein V2A87_26565, partial [Pseudomonas aeruginosa]